MAITRKLSLASLWLGTALWVLMLLQWFVICPTVAPGPPKFEPGLVCQLNSLSWFAGLLVVLLVIGVLGFKHLSVLTKSLFIIVVVLPCFALLLRWAYVSYVP
jgi:hypothetical protein